MKGQQLHVTFEDPQQELDLDAERPERRKITYTADQHGVVETVGKQLSIDDVKSEEGDGEGQPKPAEVAEGQEGAESNDQADGTVSDEYSGKEIVITVRTGSEEGQEESGDADYNLIEYIFPIVNGTGRTPKKYVNGEDMGVVLGGDIKDAIGLETNQGCYAIEDLIGAGGELRDIQGDDLSDKGELDWGGADEGNGDELSDWEREVLGETDENETDGAEEDGATGEQQAPDAGPVDMDTYILINKPRFEGINHDFPALLERRNNGETWKEIALSLGITSNQLSGAWSKYKALVQKRIEDESF
ncbi:hypothetical protein FE784_00640 [Paenibacillus hemerocallicola]|uniref:Uncharacterized protein n=1 Tax=Paenibacillus hemerocallicola TaxID=1172614 RepID=A0A5C4TGE6_9BACL|nr:hypothetical protein [Paenibacillus hemerocallicola]TNJ68204.1 hypothetical protein FE784_00640 [Paenibacillus hemerocallicola]